MKFRVHGHVDTGVGPVAVDVEVEVPKRVALLVTLAGFVLGKDPDVPGSIREEFELALDRLTTRSEID